MKRIHMMFNQNVFIWQSVVVKLDPHNFDEFSRKKYLFVEFYKGW